MAIVTAYDPGQVVSEGNSAFRVNFEITLPLERPDGSISLEALQAAVVTHYRQTYRIMANGDYADFKSDTSKSHPISLADFLSRVAVAAGLNEDAALSIFGKIVEVLDAIHEEAIQSAQPQPGEE
jgi:hypothetical protein